MRSKLDFVSLLAVLILLDHFGHVLAECPNPATTIVIHEGKAVREWRCKTHGGLELVHRYSLPLMVDPEIRLTPRQVEVLWLSAQGYTDHDIAQLLSIGFGTVRTHVRNARAALGARSRVEVIASALLCGRMDDVR